MSQAVINPAEVTHDAPRARAARIGAGVAVLAMALVVYGAYGDPHSNSSQKSAVPFLLGVVVVLSVIVYGLLAPIAVRAAATGSAAAKSWAIGLGVVSVLSLAAFWSGLPLIVGGAAALTGHTGKSRPGASRAYGFAWWAGLIAAGLSLAITVLGNTVFSR